jgi:hypothetical protein
MNITSARLWTATLAVPPLIAPAGPAAAQEADAAGDKPNILVYPPSQRPGAFNRSRTEEQISAGLGH